MSNSIKPRWKHILPSCPWRWVIGYNNTWKTKKMSSRACPSRNVVMWRDYECARKLREEKWELLEPWKGIEITNVPKNGRWLPACPKVAGAGESVIRVLGKCSGYWFSWKLGLNFCPSLVEFPICWKVGIGTCLYMGAWPIFCGVLFTNVYI